MYFILLTFYILITINNTLIYIQSPLIAMVNLFTKNLIKNKILIAAVILQMEIRYRS